MHIIPSRRMPKKMEYFFTFCRVKTGASKDHLYAPAIQKMGRRCNLTEYLTKRTRRRETRRNEAGNGGNAREI